MENEYNIVTRTIHEATIPCLVTDPHINVSLYEKDSNTPVAGEYEPTVGFTALLGDQTYRCKGERNGEEKWSGFFYVFSVVGKCLSPIRDTTIDEYISST